MTLKCAQIASEVFTSRSNQKQPNNFGEILKVKTKLGNYFKEKCLTKYHQHIHLVNSVGKVNFLGTKEPSLCYILQGIDIVEWPG